VLLSTVQVFYTTTARASEVKGHWCHACYSEARDGLTQMDGSTVRKTDLNKRKNDEEVSATVWRPAPALRV
jgi:E1A/CREB-binding protein